MFGFEKKENTKPFCYLGFDGDMIRWTRKDSPQSAAVVEWVNKKMRKATDEIANALNLASMCRDDAKASKARYLGQCAEVGALRQENEALFQKNDALCQQNEAREKQREEAQYRATCYENLSHLLSARAEAVEKQLREAQNKIRALKEEAAAPADKPACSCVLELQLKELDKCFRAAWDTILAGHAARAAKTPRAPQAAPAKK